MVLLARAIALITVILPAEWVLLSFLIYGAVGALASPPSLARHHWISFPSGMIIFVVLAALLLREIKNLSVRKNRFWWIATSLGAIGASGYLLGLNPRDGLYDFALPLLNRSNINFLRCFVLDF